MTTNQRRPHNDTIYLAPYDPQWPLLYQQHAQRIRAALGHKLLLLQHAGSTSVPGLAAKPVVDIVLAVPDSADEAAYVPALEQQGYRLYRREPDWYEHRVLKPPDLGAHLHVFTEGCEEIERMLRFRDRLRDNPADRQLYEDTKRRLAARVWQFRQDYADAKSDVVRQILTRAAADG